MAQKIGNAPPQMVFNVGIKVDIPKLLNLLSTSETHVRQVQALQVLSGNLDNIAKRAVELQDPVLINILINMKILILEKGENLMTPDWNNKVECCQKCTDGILLNCICPFCHGSGKGQSNESICLACDGKGSGDKYCNCPRGNQRCEQEIF